MLIGIDPGATGAIVVLESDFTLIDAMPMPTVKVGKTSRVNGAAIAAFLRCFDETHTFIEAVGGLPGQSAPAAFNFGHSSGLPEGIVIGLGLPYTLVYPQAWKRRAGLIGTDKDAARSRAIQLWPAWRALDKKGAGQALADAALIARFGGDRA